MATYYVFGTKKHILIKTIDDNIEVLLNNFSASSDDSGLTFDIEYRLMNNVVKKFLFITKLNDFHGFIDQIIGIFNDNGNEVTLFDYYGPLNKRKNIFIKLNKYNEKETQIQFVYNNRFSDENNNFTYDIVCYNKYIKKLIKIGTSIYKKFIKQIDRISKKKYC